MSQVTIYFQYKIVVLSKQKQIFGNTKSRELILIHFKEDRLMKTFLLI